MKTFDLILANTTRSEVYLNEFIDKNYLPNRVLYVENDSGMPMMGQNTFESVATSSAKPIQIMNALSEYNIDYIKINNAELETEATYNWLEHCKSDFIVYSGFGGKILSRNFFKFPTPILHAHGGILPRYRGSTCNYYSYLERNQVGSSTIIMSEILDDGEVLDVVKTDQNLNLLEFDHKLDAQLRIKSILNVLAGKGSVEYKLVGEIPIYNYVIHPVLKHLAIIKSELTE